jgi:hypothetical protein
MSPLGIATKPSQGKSLSAPRADEGRECREGRASGRVRVEGDQAAFGCVQRGCRFTVQGLKPLYADRRNLSLLGTIHAL